MATIDPSFRNLIQFVPQQSQEENDNKSIAVKPQHKESSNGEDIKNFYEALVCEDSSSQNSSLSDYSSWNSSKLEPRRGIPVKDTCKHETSRSVASVPSPVSLRRTTRGKRKILTDTTVTKTPENQTTTASSGASSCLILDQKQRQHLKLLQAAQLGDSEQVSRLLGQGLDIDYRDFYGWTPLMCAAKEGHIKVVHTLLIGGADCTARNSDSQTAVMLAQSSGHTTVVEEISNFKHPCLMSYDAERTKAASSTYFCEICKSEFLLSGKKAHETSTVHLFNAGHKPKGPSYLIPETNRGFQMLLRTGWEVDKGLGPTGEGHKYPVKTILKHDRKGFGGEDRNKKKAKVTHFNPNDKSAIVRNSNIPQRTMSARKAAQYSVKARERKEKRREQRLRFELGDGFQ